MKKQIYTTKDLSEGKVAIAYKGNLERLKEVLIEAFPMDTKVVYGMPFYSKNRNVNRWESFMRSAAHHAIFVSEEEILLIEEYEEYTELLQEEYISGNRKESVINLLGSELDQSQYISNFDTTIGEPLKVSAERVHEIVQSVEKKLPCVTVYQNGICVVKDFHFQTNDETQKGMYAQNEFQEIFIPNDCITIFDKLPAGKKQHISENQTISNDQVYDKLAEICGLSSKNAFGNNHYEDDNGNQYRLTKFGFQKK